MTPCLICRQPLEPFLSFGRMPIANGFLTEAQFAEEPFFNLSVAFCSNCKMTQLTDLVDPGKMFHENYAFFSSTSTRMADHFREFADGVKSSFLGPDPFVVEIGSNDGILLRHFAEAGVRHLGVEPSANVAQVACDRGVNTISAFFGPEVAAQIAAEHGQADALLGANVMCHIPDLHGVVTGARLLLKPTGVLIFEDPYLGDIIEKTAYDQIYDEHAFYFSVTSLDYLFARHEMEIVDVMPQPTHGGSMRYVVAHRGARPVSAAVAAQRAKEERLRIGDAATYEAFRRKVEQSRDALMSLLRSLKARGKTIAAYAATSKSTTVANFCGITPDLVEFISDTTPLKQGKFSPGTHIPVKPPSEFETRQPDFALLFAWNHAEEIKAKETVFADRGGRWIVYVPEVAIE
jgi:methylation protein EvaC